MKQVGDEELYLLADFETLYRRHCSALFRFVYRFTLNRESAEEILHDIFAQLMAGKFSPLEGASLKSWLFTLAKNKSLNFLKHAAFEVKHATAVDGAVGDSDLESQTIDSDLARGLTVVEKRLPDDLRDVWSLKKTGLDNGAIAQRLSIPLGTVKSRLHRLVLFLRKELVHDT